MNLDEQYEMNEEARRPETEKIECHLCGIELSPGESADPMTIKIPITGFDLHIEREVCDACKSDHQQINFINT